MGYNKFHYLFQGGGIPMRWAQPTAWRKYHNLILGQVNVAVITKFYLDVFIVVTDPHNIYS
jgi:hypothetical protein